MKTINIEQASNQAIDWLVANLNGISVDIKPIYAPDAPKQHYILVLEGEDSDGDDEVFAPTTDWDHGGPFLNREIRLGMTVTFNENDDAFEAYYGDGQADKFVRGDSTLQAALRCYLVRSYGISAAVPDELAT